MPRTRTAPTPADATGQLHRVPARCTEPPYDDEAVVGGHLAARAAVQPASQGTLALAFSLPGGVPAEPPVPRRLSLVPRTGLQTSLRGRGEDEDGPRPTPSTALPDARAWAAKLVQAVTEVQAGTRPCAQLLRWTTGDVYAALQRRAAAASPRASSLRSVVRSVHVCKPVDGVAEVSAVVHVGRRAHALALRLEGLDGRWQCTALEVG